MKKFWFLYSVGAYLAGLGVLVYMVFWLYPWPWMPATIDSGEASLPLWAAVAADVALVALFGLQHSLMVRPRFKAWMARFVPPEAQRATYTYASALVLLILLLFWQPIPEPRLWAFEKGIGYWAATAALQPRK